MSQPPSPEQRAAQMKEAIENAQRAFEQDMQDVEQEAREQLARESSPPASAPKRPRPMV